jgi:hypothetical protein
MSTQTPRRTLTRPRPFANKGINTSSTPNLVLSYTNGATPAQGSTLSGLRSGGLLSRKSSLSALTQGSLATIPDASESYGLSTLDEDSLPGVTQATMTQHTPMRGDGADVEVGDLVDVPGNMHGTVKFVGSVQGKKGVFAGVELSEEFAAKGKNNGDVDG